MLQFLWTPEKPVPATRAATSAKQDVCPVLQREGRIQGAGMTQACPHALCRLRLLLTETEPRSSPSGLMAAPCPGLSCFSIVTVPSSLCCRHCAVITVLSLILITVLVLHACFLPCVVLPLYRHMQPSVWPLAHLSDTVPATGCAGNQTPVTASRGAPSWQGHGEPGARRSWYWSPTPGQHLLSLLKQMFLQGPRPEAGLILVQLQEHRADVCPGGPPETRGQEAPAPGRFRVGQPQQSGHTSQHSCAPWCDVAVREARVQEQAPPGAQCRG